MAIKRVFKDHAYKVPISSTKSWSDMVSAPAVPSEAGRVCDEHPTQRDPPDDQLARAGPAIATWTYVPNEARAVEVR